MESKPRNFNRAAGVVFVLVVGAIFWTAFGFGLARLLG